LVAQRDLARHGVAEVAVVLVARRDREVEALAEVAVEFDVDRAVVARMRTGIARLEPGEYLRARGAGGRRRSVGAYQPGGLLAGVDGVLLLAVFRAEGDGGRARPVEVARHVDVEQRL